VASKYHIDGVGLAVAMLASLAHSPAFADEANATKCSETYIRGQTLRNEHRLIEARETLRACVQSGCKVFVVRDCAAWLDQVQSSLPTVVPVAVDGDYVIAGASVLNAGTQQSLIIAYKLGAKDTLPDTVGS